MGDLDGGRPHALRIVGRDGGHDRLGGIQMAPPRSLLTCFAHALRRIRKNAEQLLGRRDPGFDHEAGVGEQRVSRLDGSDLRR